MASPTPVPLLWVLNNDLPPYPVEVTPFPFTMGRHSSNHLPLRHAAVSRHHAEIVRSEAGDIQLRDLHSSGGTLVNGEPVSAATLADGDEITLGKVGGVRLLYLSQPALTPLLLLYLEQRPMQRLTLGEGKFTIGRNADCSLMLKSASVSRYHAEIIHLPDGSYQIRDLNSIGGTFVNGQSIREVTLSSGDTILISRPAAARLRFVSDHQPTTVFGADDTLTEETAPDTTLVLDERQTRFLNPELMATAANLSAKMLRRLTSLCDITHQLMAQSSVPALAETWLTALFATLPLDYGIVLVGNRQTQQLEVAGMRGQGRPSRSILARVQRDRVGCLSSDVRSDERFATTQSLALTGTRAILAVPIASGKNFWGIGYFSNEHHPGAFESEDLEFVLATARTAGLMLDNLHLIRELRATQDLLVQADRLATVGKMCASISHELRNRLALINGVELIGLKYPHDPDVRRLTDLALHGQRRALELVEEIRLFARNAPTQYAFEHRTLRPMLERLLSLICVDTQLKQRTVTFQVQAEPCAVVNEPKSNRSSSTSSVTPWMPPRPAAAPLTSPLGWNRAWRRFTSPITGMASHRTFCRASGSHSSPPKANTARDWGWKSAAGLSRPTMAACAAPARLASARVSPSCCRPFLPSRSPVRPTPPGNWSANRARHSRPASDTASQRRFSPGGV